MNESTLNEVVVKNKLLMAVRGENLVYIADGTELTIEKVKKSFQNILKVPIVEVEISDDCNIKELRENAVLLNETFGYLLQDSQGIDQ